MANRDTLQPAFGAALRRSRLARAASQEELAERSGLHWTYISELERGLKSPTLATIVALAGALECRAWELVQGPRSRTRAPHPSGRTSAGPQGWPRPRPSRPVADYELDAVPV